MLLLEVTEFPEMTVNWRNIQKFESILNLLKLKICPKSVVCLGLINITRITAYIYIYCSKSTTETTEMEMVHVEHFGPVQVINLEKKQICDQIRRQIIDPNRFHWNMYMPVVFSHFIPSPGIMGAPERFLVKILVNTSGLCIHLQVQRLSSAGIVDWSVADGQYNRTIETPLEPFNVEPWDKRR